jgi:poly-gamma-glutamate synthesis protein (capsule biosynthesis protein)
LKIIFTGDLSLDWMPQPGFFQKNPRLLLNDPEYSNQLKTIAKGRGISWLQTAILNAKIRYQTDRVTTGVKKEFGVADFVCPNLESTVTFGTESLKGKRYVLKAEPYYLSVLKKLNVSTVCLANNHIMDYGKAGIDDTLRFLDLFGISYCGIRKEVTARQQPCVSDDGTDRVGILNYVEPSIIDPDPHLFFEQEPCPFALEPERVTKDIESALQNGPVIVVLHWGNEWNFLESDYQKQLAHRFIDDGASAVIGHHSHLVGGAEKYKNGIIAYSLGNLYMMLPDFSGLRAKHRVAIELDVTGDGLHGFKLIPISSDSDGFPLIADKFKTESLYNAYLPPGLPERDKIIFDSFSGLPEAELITRASGKKSGFIWSDDYFYENEIVQGKLPLGPGWRAKEALWTGTFKSREFMGKEFLLVNSSHMYDDGLLINRFRLNRSPSRLTFIVGYPESFHLLDEFACPEAEISCDGQPVFNFSYAQPTGDWQKFEIPLEPSDNQSGELTLSIKGVKDKFSYLCWRLLAF